MKNKKILVRPAQIERLAEVYYNQLKEEDIEGIAGTPEDRRIEYPSPEDIEALKMGGVDDENSNVDGVVDSDAINPSDMKSPPHELLSYLDKIEEAKSILSKVAAKEDNENIKNRIYAHYEKAQKLAFELIKEFGIVH